MIHCRCFHSLISKSLKAEQHCDSLARAGGIIVTIREPIRPLGALCTKTNLWKSVSHWKCKADVNEGRGWDDDLLAANSKSQ